MCGLVGVLGQGPELEQQVRHSLQALIQRGPDCEGFWASEGCVLGHRRLSIAAPSDPPQPVFSEDRQVAAVVNGEFYTYRSLRSDLEKRGHRFSTDGDSELVCHLYEEYGLDFVQHLCGEFALILYDVRRRRLVAARDPYGVKPLCYSQWDGRLWLASKARGLWAAGCARAWDEQAFYQACSTQYVLPGQSYFRQIQQLPPGSILVADNDSPIRIDSYLRWQDTQLQEQPVEQFLELFQQAVWDRIETKQPYAFQLSGGLDSGCVLALAAQREKPHAFTVCFPGTPMDETAQAEEIARHCGAHWHRVDLNAQQLIEGLDTAAASAEGMAINAHLSAKYRLAEAVKAAGFKVVLTGEGADEVLLGYPHYRLDLGADPARLASSNQASAGIMWSQFAGLDTSAIRTQLGHVPHFLQAKASLGRRLHSLMKSDFLADHASFDPFAAMLEGADLKELTQVEQSACLWNRSALANYILMTLGDGCEMAHSLEGRLPFLDIRLAQFLRNVPLEWKIHQGQEKRILREALQPLIPQSLYRREKHPFMAPSLQPYLHQRLMEIQQHRFVDVQKLRARLASMPQESPAEQREWEPALIWILTSDSVEKGCGLSS